MRGDDEMIAIDMEMPESCRQCELEKFGEKGADDEGDAKG